MSCASRTLCEGCTCSGRDNPQPINIEDYEKELLAVRKREKELLAMLKKDETSKASSSPTGRKLRSSKWFSPETNPAMSSIYIERYLNYGITREELTSGKPIIGISQSGSDLAPCNRYHLELAKRVREGIRSAGGIAFEFPMHPIQESSRRPTACLDRNLAYLGLVEILFSYPLDGVVLLTGCDKTTPACLMAAATVVSFQLLAPAALRPC
jgi:dihydroxy-acid dehydratase